jgi:hypothetical protein
MLKNKAASKTLIGKVNRNFLDITQKQIQSWDAT